VKLRATQIPIPKAADIFFFSTAIKTSAVEKSVILVTESEGGNQIPAVAFPHLVDVGIFVHMMGQFSWPGAVNQAGNACSGR
jgi:hypothetical protein